MELVIRPAQGIGLNIGADLIVGCLVADDMFVIIALPDGYMIVSWQRLYSFRCP